MRVELGPTFRLGSHALLALILLLVARPLSAEMADVLSYRGLLVRPDGRLAADDAYELELSIHDAAVGGNRLFGQMVRTRVQAGLYEIHLTGSPGRPLAEVLSGGERYLEVAVVSGGGLAGGILAPRQRIASVPFALFSAEAETTASFEAELPGDALILWDQATGCEGDSDTCPCGFAAAPEFAGMTVRGALPTETPGAGAGVPGGSGADGDRLTVAEMPSHTHALDDGGGHRHRIVSWGGTVARQGGSGAQAGPDPFDDREIGVPLKSSYSDYSGGHVHVVESAGQDGPHFHPLRSVLFCRKLAP